MYVGVYKEIITLIWFCSQPNRRQKEKQGAEEAHLLKPQKAHPTSEFIRML